MYISVSDAASNFNISKRRVQTLCEQGRINGATRISGVWLIPSDAKKPSDARSKQTNFNQLSWLDNTTNSDSLNLQQVCDILAISEATAKNWIRLGKLKTIDNATTFDKVYIEKLLKEIKNSDDHRLKSRRNKKNISGKVLYKDYIKNPENRKVVAEIIGACDYIDETELRVILAHFAINLYVQNTVDYSRSDLPLDKKIASLENKTFKNLVLDLLGCVDPSAIMSANVKCALDYTLKHIPYEDTLGFAYISLKDINSRKKTGAYYTPQNIVNTLIDDLFQCQDMSDKSICDPCCGTGNFLIGLLGRGVNINNIYGYDIDEISILLTRINVFLLDNKATLQQLYSHFMCANTLDITFNNNYSVVLGNPPWGYEFNKAEISRLHEHFTVTSGKSTESFELFIEKGLQMIDRHGYIAFVLPESILNVSSHKQVRELILNNTTFKFVNYLGNAFSSVQCPAITLGLQSGGTRQTRNCLVKYEDKQFFINKNRDIDSSCFSLNVSDEDYDCLQQIESLSNHTYLANNARFALGIVTGNNKQYIKDRQESNTEIILKGCDIYRYSIKHSDNYINYTPESFQQVAPTEIYRADEKLLYRFISDVPVFTYDNKQTLTLNSCNILIPQVDGLNIKYILAVLNSSVAAYYLKKRYNSIKLLRSHIESLPIPVASISRQNSIIQKVNKLLDFGGNRDVIYRDLDLDIMQLYCLNNKQQQAIENVLINRNMFLAS